MIAWIMSHWAAVLAILLGIVRVLESIAVVLPEKPKGILDGIIKTIKEFFRFS